MIYQENSSVVPSSRLSPQGLTTDKSAIETTVVVDDGQIMVLGGLLKDEYGGNVSQGAVPRRPADRRRRCSAATAARARKSNLMVFLRPMVIRTQEDSNALSMDRYDLIRARSRASGSRGRASIMPINDAPVAPAAPAPTPGTPLRNGTVPPPLSWPEPLPATVGATPRPSRRIRRVAARDALGHGRRMGTRHPLPYAFAKANTLLLEDDGAQLVLWAAETTPPARCPR